MAAGSGGASGFGVIQCLRSRPGSDSALRLLQEAAQEVAPIMLKRQWQVQQLVEFYPTNPALLGLNVNRRAKICVRLRQPGDASVFFPLEDVVGTLLHELAHIVRGPHDAAFYKLLDELTGEWEGYMLRRKFGVGAAAAVPQPTFTGQGQRLAVSSRSGLTPAEAARKAALQRHAGRRLGGPEGDASPTPGSSNWRATPPGLMAVSAAERRLRDSVWCMPDQQHASTPVLPSSTGTASDAPKRAKPSEATWLCEACTLINENPMANTCELCGQARGGTQVGVDPPSASSQSTTPAKEAAARWPCPGCTFLNSPLLPTCEMCETPRRS